MTSERMVVGVCTYNRGPALVNTLRALAAMDTCGGRVARILVVDNNCADGTAERVRGFAAQNRDIPVELVHEAEQGLSAARRRLLQATDEAVVAFVDDDCIPDARWAAACLARFDAAERAGAVGGRVTLEWESGPTRLARRCAVQLAQQELGELPHRLDDSRSFLVGAGLAMRRRALLDAGWPARTLLGDRAGSSLSSGGDTEICARLRRAGWELWYEPGASMRHLIPAGRQSRDYLRRLVLGTARSEPLIEWLARGEPGAEWIAAGARRARRKWLRTLLLEWRPHRRFVRLTQRAGRREGWESLLAAVSGPQGGSSA